MDEVTFKVPAAMVNVPAIPSVELEDNCRDVPLMAASKRLALPLKVDVPVNVTVPAVARKLPFTERPDDMEKTASVVTEPVTDNTLKVLLPVPDIVFEVPLMVITPALAVKFPLTDKLPVRAKVEAVLTEPLTVRLSNEIPAPLILVPEPVIENVPPEAWLNEPAPVVSRLPVREIVPAEKLTGEAATVRL